MRISDHHNQKALHEELQRIFESRKLSTHMSKPTIENLQLIRSTSSALFGGGRVASFEPYEWHEMIVLAIVLTNICFGQNEKSKLPHGSDNLDREVEWSKM